MVITLVTLFKSNGLVESILVDIEMSRRRFCIKWCPTRNQLVFYVPMSTVRRVRIKQKHSLR